MDSRKYKPKSKWETLLTKKIHFAIQLWNRIIKDSILLFFCSNSLYIFSSFFDFITSFPHCIVLEMLHSCFDLPYDFQMCIPICFDLTKDYLFVYRTCKKPNFVLFAFAAFLDQIIYLSERKYFRCIKLHRKIKEKVYLQFSLVPKIVKSTIRLICSAYKFIFIYWTSKENEHKIQYKPACQWIQNLYYRCIVPFYFRWKKKCNKNIDFFPLFLIVVDLPQFAGNINRCIRHIFFIVASIE